MSKRGKDTGMMKRRKKARLRFKSIVRMVMFNKVWLQDLEEQKISTNIKKNISMLVRQQKKIGILTMAEKSLIMKPPWSRTIQDRKKLVSLMLSLTCFASFPPNAVMRRRRQVRTRFKGIVRMVIFNKTWLQDIEDQNVTTNIKKNIAMFVRQQKKIGILTMAKIRARLASVVKFLYVSHGRTIIREGGMALSIYFVLTGEVEVTKRVYDLKTDSYVEKLENIYGPGDIIGDVELVEKCKRQYTCKGTSDVELLTVVDDDFDRVLRPFMESQWEQKKRALASFDYFKNWTPAQISAVCKMGLLKQYESLETIYYEDQGPLSHVHFVISGQCMILQCLKLKVTEKKGQKVFTLLDLNEDESDLLFSQLTREELLKKLNETKSGAQPATHEDESPRSSETEEDEEVEEEVAGVYKKARKSDFKRYALLCGVDLSTPQERRASIPIFEEALKRLSTGSTKSIQPPKRASLYDRLDINEDEDFKFENHFIDVGTLTFGGIFGLGEHIENRVIMARTTVQCLLIPRFWLLEKDQNPGNIWQRMRFYLDTTIPSRAILFQDFLATRKWHTFKKQIIHESLDETKIGNPTKMEDIPIICRIVEAEESDVEDEKDEKADKAEKAEEDKEEEDEKPRKHSKSESAENVEEAEEVEDAAE